MYCTDQCDGHPTLYVAARPGVGLLPFFLEADVYMFKLSLCIHAEYAVPRDDEWVKVMILTEESLQLLSIFSPLPLSGGKSPANCSGEIGRQCSQHTCRE